MYKSLRQKRRKDITSYLLRTVSVLCGHLIKHCKIDIFFLIRVCKIFYFLPRPAGPWQRRRLSSEVWGEEVHIWVLVKRGFLRLLGFFCFLKKKLKIEKGLVIPSLIWGHTENNGSYKIRTRMLSYLSVRPITQSSIIIFTTINFCYPATMHRKVKIQLTAKYLSVHEKRTRLHSRLCTR